MPYFVAFFMLPGVAFANSSMTDFLFIQLLCKAIFAGPHCFLRENFLAPFLISADAYT